MLRRRALVGAVAAMFGIAPALALDRSAEAKSHRAEEQRVGPFIQQGEALTREGAQRRLFGADVAVSDAGDTALINEVGEDAVWVYTRSGSSWAEQAKLSAPDNETLNNFGSQVALSADGDTALISDPGHEISSCSAEPKYICCGGLPQEKTRYTESAVLVFARSGSTWSQVARLAPGEKTETEGFGQRIALSGDGNTALASSEGGPVWVFARSGVTWSQQARLVGAPTSREGSFGTSIALSADGDTALVANASTARASGNAVVWVFTRSSGAWSEDQKLTGSGEEFDTFGTSVAVSGEGDMALISGVSESRSSVWAFGRSGSTWAPQESPIHPGGNYGYGLGEGAYLIVRLSADGDTAVVSGGGEGKEGQLPVWVFTRSSSTWSKGEKLAGGGGDFGESVALSGEGHTVLVGEPREHREESERAGCKGPFEPLDSVRPLAAESHGARQVPQALAANAPEGGRVWIFQESSANGTPPEELCPPEASNCATLIVRVYGGFSPIEKTPQERAKERARDPHGAPLDHVRLRIEKLGPGGKVLTTTITRDHTVRVAPGRYAVQIGRKRVRAVRGDTRKEVAIGPGKTLEVTLEAPAK